MLSREQRLEAVADLERLSRERPGDASILNNLAVHIRALGDAPRAIGFLKRAIALSPDQPAFHANLGNAYGASGDIDGAIDAYRAAYALDPASPTAAIQLAGAQHRAKRLADGLMVTADALALHPDHAGLHNAHGALLCAQRHYEAALAHFRRAIALDPMLGDAYANAALASMQLGQNEAAVDLIDDAVARLGPSADLLAQKGQSLVSLGRPEDGIACFDRALALAPAHLDAQLGRARALFLIGDHARAWPAYAARWSRPENKRPDVGIPFWRDEDPARHGVFVVNEQGLGDTINFCRYLPVLARRAARVAFACQAPLVDLLRTSFPGIRIVPAGKRPRDLEIAISLLDLPPMLGMAAPYWPGAPYLASNRPAPITLPAEGGKRVGLVWAGNPDHGNDRFRSLDLASLLFLAEDPRAQIVSLQKGPAAASRRTLGAEHLMRDASDRLYSFADTAALVARLDLVITVDTAVAHLAGALGKPVWVLLPAAPDWRWGLTGDHTPWYPSMRLFRQTVLGEWHAPLEALRAAWDEWLASSLWRRRSSSVT
jgi:tetratricopeptide (TPR) repeat protein